MSADTFTTAMFLITAVIAAGVLISAIFPVFYQMTGTFSSAGHTADVQLRTNMQIILDVANQSQYARVWIKNTGSERVALADIQRSNVICGDAGNFNLLSLSQTGTLSNGQWSYVLYDLNDNNFWDPGETLEIDAHTSTIQTADPVYFQFSLPNGNSISDQFMVSTTP
ncbi:flagellin [Methanoregula sp.]|jgi:flagellar protein FlaG|uniref:flagellin n=1 Tax=Methanoregula sp. TaxID=2052170 RepID=UPI003C790497